MLDGQHAPKLRRFWLHPARNARDVAERCEMVRFEFDGGCGRLLVGEQHDSRYASDAAETWTGCDDECVRAQVRDAIVDGEGSRLFAGWNAKAAA